MASNIPGLGVDPSRPPGPPSDPPAAPASGIDPNASLRPAKQTRQSKGPKLPSKKRVPDGQELHCPTEKLPRTSQPPGSIQAGSGFGGSPAHSGRAANPQHATGGAASSQPTTGGAAISQRATGGASSSQPTTGGAAISQRATGGASSSQPANEVNPVLREAEILQLANRLQKELLEEVGRPPGAPKCRPYLKEFITAAETFKRKLQKEEDRKVRLEAKQTEVNSARSRSIDAAAESQKFDRQAKELTRQAIEAKLRSENADADAKKLEKERATIGDSSSREGTPEADSSTR
jgi:hypothetical protein